MSNGSPRVGGRARAPPVDPVPYRRHRHHHPVEDCRCRV